MIGHDTYPRLHFVRFPTIPTLRDGRNRYRASSAPPLVIQVLGSAQNLTCFFWQ